MHSGITPEMHSAAISATNPMISYNTIVPKKMMGSDTAAAKPNTDITTANKKTVMAACFAQPRRPSTFSLAAIPAMTKDILISTILRCT